MAMHCNLSRSTPRHYYAGHAHAKVEVAQRISWRL